MLFGLGILTIGAGVMFWFTTPTSSKAPSQETKFDSMASNPKVAVPPDAGAQEQTQASSDWQEPSSPANPDTPASPADEPVETTAIRLANSDLKKATDWLAQIQDPDLRLRATLAIGNEAIRTNPLVALNLVASLQPSPQRDDIIHRGVAEWALTDAVKAKEWALQIEDEPLRADAIASIATSWSDSKPVEAANLVLDELPEGRLQSDTLVSIIQRWSQADPKAAAKWVEQFPEGELKTAAEKNLLRNR